MKKSIRLVIVVLVTITIFASGCGGGGGGSTSVPNPGQDVLANDLVAPGTNVLSTPSALFSYTSNAAKTAIKVPADSTDTYFALTVCNTDSAAQTVTIKPESFVLGNELTPGIKKSVQMADPVTSKLARNQAKIDGIMRLQAENRLKSAGTPGLRRSIRASDNSAEKVGDIVPIKIIGDYYGSTYLTRNCKLERMGTHCKIFVDQESFKGLDATKEMTGADYDHFMQQYDDIIWPLITNEFSQIYDIDNDSRVSIVFSPVYTKLGFAGLFNSNNFESNKNSNQRDMIAIFSPDPSSGWGHAKWLPAARETLCHESQHLANYSAHFYFAPIAGKMEAEWLDEGLAVSSEARYRILRGDNPSENRFKLWADNPSSVGLTNFNRSLAQYGAVGLFAYYLYEQTDAATVKKLLESASETGIANINKVFAAQGGMNTLFKNWSMAALMEGAKKHSIVDISKVDAKYKFKAALNLDVKYTSLAYGYSSTPITVQPYGVALYIIRQPSGFSSDEYRFRVESSSGKNVEISMMKLPQ